MSLSKVKANLPLVSALCALAVFCGGCIAAWTVRGSDVTGLKAADAELKVKHDKLEQVVHSVDKAVTEIKTDIKWIREKLK